MCAARWSGDSAVLSALARADVLIVRAAHAPAAVAGDAAQVIRIA
jgi:hypothetical protein